MLSFCSVYGTAHSNQNPFEMARKTNKLNDIRTRFFHFGCDYSSFFSFSASQNLAVHRKGKNRDLKIKMNKQFLGSKRAKKRAVAIY